MKTNEFVDLYVELFAGRPDTYAILREWEKDGKSQKVYMPSTFTPSSENEEKRKKQEYTQKFIDEVTDDIGTKEYGPEAALAHLRGDHFLGVYPLNDNSEVRFFALDFDGKNGDPWQEALRQYEIFKDEAEIPVYIERSRSGNGYHIWGFLEEWLPAVKVRGAIRPFIEGADTFDRMFPNQDYTSGKKPLGNLIALPLYGPTVAEGKGAFVEPGDDGDPYEIEDQKAFLADMERVSTQRIYELFEDAPTPERGERREAKEREGEIDPLGGAFKVVHEEYGCEWVRWCLDNAADLSEIDWWMLSHQFAQLEGGRDLFHEWSEAYSGYDPDETDAKFDQALDQNAPHTCEYIREHTTGEPCYCDERFPGEVYHPYDLAKIPIRDLMEEEEDDAFETPEIGIVEAFDWIKEVQIDPESGMGLRYGIEELDEYTRARDSDLVIIAARPGMGKTALGIEMLLNMTWGTETPGYIFSMEMAKEQLWRRAIANRSQVSLNSVLKGKLTKSEWKRLLRQRKFAETGDIGLFVNDRIRDADQLADVAGEMIFQHGPGPILIDYLQLAKSKERESAQERTARVSDDYKALAKILKVPVIALTQLNRSADDAEVTSQTYDHWLRESGVVEQSADVIMFILGSKGPGVVERVIVLHKERHRENGHRISLEFNQPLMSFDKAGTWGLTDTRDQSLTGRLRAAAMASPMRQGLLGGGGLMSAALGDDDYDLGDDEEGEDE